LGSQTIAFTRPVMPEFLDEIRLSNLQIGQAAADVLLQRKAHEVATYLVGRRGAVDLLTIA
jgi:hypothetical protein